MRSKFFLIRGPIILIFSLFIFVGCSSNNLQQILPNQTELGESRGVMSPIAPLNTVAICRNREECAAAGYPGYDEVERTSGNYNQPSYYIGGNQQVTPVAYGGGGGNGSLLNCKPGPGCVKSITGPISLLTRQKILKTANAYRGTNTFAKFKTHDACSNAVADILMQAGITLKSPSGTTLNAVAWLPDLTKAMLKAGATETNVQSQALAGDIAVQDYAGLGPNGGQNHVGVCMSDGCSVVLSNATSLGTFTSVSDPTFSILNPSVYLPNLKPGFFHFP